MDGLHLSAEKFKVNEPQTLNIKPSEGTRKYIFAANNSKETRVIRNIIFDLGGVLIPLNMEATRSAFIEMGAKNFDEMYTQAKQVHFFDDYDKGLITDETFRNYIRKYLNHHVSNKQVDVAWNAMLGLIPENKIKLLEKLKDKFYLYLLSNTNTLHVREFTRMHFEHYGYDIFSALFIKNYYSNEIKMRKPDKEIFELLINENKLIPAETLFIDDSLQHIEGAKITGLQTAYLNVKETTLENLLITTLNIKW